MVIAVLAGVDVAPLSSRPPKVSPLRFATVEKWCGLVRVLDPVGVVTLIFVRMTMGAPGVLALGGLDYVDAALFGVRVGFPPPAAGSDVFTGFDCPGAGCAAE